MIAIAATALAVAAAASAVRDLAWPLSADHGVTSGFGDLRQNHLHAGYDLSTRGENGLAVRAVADGEVVRLKVEWRGYGNAVYVRHAGGDESVYAHLQSFAAPLEAAASAARQRAGTRYPGNVVVDPPVRVRRGETIGISGESGVGAPHLHLEWRGRDGQEPTDLRTVGLPASRVAAKPEVVRVFVNARGELRVAARVRAGGKEYGVAGLEVEVGGEPFYRARIARVDFTSYLHPGALYDVEDSDAAGLPVYSLDAAGAEIWPGQVWARSAAALAPGRHDVRVTVSEPAGKTAHWKGTVAVPTPAPGVAVEPPVQSLADGRFRLELPQGTLHRGTAVTVTARGEREAEIAPSWEPPRPGARLRWEPPAGVALARLGIYRVTASGALRGGSRVDGGALLTSVHRFGRYRVVEDLTPPTLAKLRRGVCAGIPCLRVDVADDLSGLEADSVRFVLPDGREEVAAVDPDRGWADIPAAAATGTAGVRVRASDGAGNVTWLPSAPAPPSP